MDNLLKRKREGTDNATKKMKKDDCPHKERCYRKNPEHFNEYEHPHLVKFLETGDPIPDEMPQPKYLYQEQLAILKPILKAQKDLQFQQVYHKKDLNSAASPSSTKDLPDESPSTSAKERVFKRGKIKTSFRGDSEVEKCKPGVSTLEKLRENAPYHLFFTTIPESPSTNKEKNTIIFTDLLCPSLGPLKESLQINFMIDIDWLLKQYEARNVMICHRPRDSDRLLDLVLLSMPFKGHYVAYISHNNKVGMNNGFFIMEKNKPLTILYGDDWTGMVEFMNKFCPNVKYHFVEMEDPTGCHHSKIGIYAYEDNSIRIVVSTANLYFEDWNYYNQGLWISPRCKRLPETSTAKDGESPTLFKSNLTSYLRSYNLGILKDWISYVERADFSDVRVFFIASVPGKHYPTSTGCHLHTIGELLSKHVELPEKKTPPSEGSIPDKHYPTSMGCHLLKVDELLTKCIEIPEKTTPHSEGPLDWAIVAQVSSIGSMGINPADWLRGSLLRTLASHRKGQLPGTSNVSLSLVYPSVENVMTGYFGAQSGGCLPYSKVTNEKQRWLEIYMCQWKADHLNRTRAMPHINSYCRVSPCLTKLAYFLLTSSTLSRSAWGGKIQKDGEVYVRSYEVGVLYLPNFFDEEYFEIKRTLNAKNQNVFPFMYDLPLTHYIYGDYPWCN